MTRANGSLLPKQAQARIGRIGVIGGCPSTRNFAERQLDAQSGTIGTVRGHRLHRIRYGHDARIQQDGFALQTLRVTADVHALVVLQRNLRHRPGPLYSLQHNVARLCMSLKNKMALLHLLAPDAVMGAIYVGEAVAATGSGPISVSATVTAQCAVGASTLAFGSRTSAASASNIDVGGSVSVTCTLWLSLSAIDPQG
jgi:Spore Coat Protein U domain